MSRDWGVWTKLKLDILSEYLHRFTLASSKVGTTVYLDLFAGQAENTLRATGMPIDGSPARALQADPPLTRVVLFERPARAEALEQELRVRFPQRADDIRMWAGDCNDRIDAALRDLAGQGLQWAPTFAFIDQQGPDIRWATLEKLSRYRTGKYKTEMWIFFGHALLPRGLGIRTPSESFAREVDDMLGTTAWRAAYEARLRGEITPRHLREELDNWMRWRLQHVLGYKHTHTFEVHNESGQPIYTMIFATDHPAGDRIMAHLYGMALREFPHMLSEARRLRVQKTGQGQLFELDESSSLVALEDLYLHVEPHTPYGTQVGEPGRG